MQKNESNKLSMFEAVVSLLDANTGRVATITALEKAFADFKSVVANIKGTNLEFIGRTKSETAHKLMREEILRSRVIKISSALLALGADTSNNDLLLDAKVSKSSMKDMRDNLLSNKCMLICERADAYQNELVEYGITAQAIAEAKTALTNFNDAIAKQSDERADALATRKDVTEMFRAATNALRNKIDKLMHLFKSDDTHFYNEYKTARVIKDLGLRHEKDEVPADETN